MIVHSVKSPIRRQFKIYLQRVFLPPLSPMLANIHSIIAYKLYNVYQYLPTSYYKTRPIVLCSDTRTDVGLPTKFRFNGGPASQPIAGSMPVKRLRRWPNTNPSLGLLYTLRKHVVYPQCCFNVDPQSLTLAQNWNSIGRLYRVFWLLHGGWLFWWLFIPAPETPDNTIHWPNADVMLCHCRRWANIIPIKSH